MGSLRGWGPGMAWLRPSKPVDVVKGLWYNQCMPLVRMLVSWGPAAYEVRDRLTNTLYFNVSGSVDDPDYQGLADDLRDIYAEEFFSAGCKIEVRAYNMDDAKPRPERAYSTVQSAGNFPATANQVSICLSYYADRNLPRRRGRIYLGPFSPNGTYIVGTNYTNALALGQKFAGLGGLNVDWSVYSPTTNEHYRISDIWVDNSWDIVRSRKMRATNRITASING